MQLKKAGEVTSQRQLDETEGGHFTGMVQIEELVRSEPAPEVPGTKILRVSFQPKARTHWHSHPKGQVLHILAGKGLVQERGGAITEIAAGDTVYAAHDVDHWHGAAPDSPMTHLAVSPYTAERDTEWKGKVTDNEYSGGGAAN